MLKYLFCLIAILSPIQVLTAQCFKNCQNRLETAIDTLPGANSFEKSKYNFMHVKLNDRILKEVIGCKFPEVELQSMDEKMILISKISVQPKLIHFWFSSCPPCIEELPLINKLHSKFKDKVNFIDITFDEKAQVESFYSKHKSNSLHLRINREILEREFCCISGYPMNILLDENNLVIDVWAGKITKKEYLKKFKKALKK
jgi:thiol-disulfide isomerase/thioredoxin